MKLVDQLIETISKDIEEIVNPNNVDQKLVRKDCNLIKKRIADLNKLFAKDANADEIKKKLLVFTKKLEAFLNK